MTKLYLPIGIESLVRLERFTCAKPFSQGDLFIRKTASITIVNQETL
jgi:hypothetical protein